MKRELITKTEAAKRLEVSPRTIARAVDSGIYVTRTINKRKLLVWYDTECGVGLLRTDSQDCVGCNHWTPWKTPDECGVCKPDFKD